MWRGNKAGRKKECGNFINIGMGKIKKYRAIHWRMRNWWVLPIVLLYKVLYELSYHFDEWGTSLNMWELDNLK